jgi:seryl-tRNA synthetase
MRRRGVEDVARRLLDVDEEWRARTQEAEELRARQKAIGKPSSQDEIDELRELKDRLKAAQDALAAAQQERERLLATLPNLPDQEAPDGGEDDAVELRRVGEPREFGARDALDLATPSGWIDMERGAKVSGSRFAYRVGDVALLELALYRFALDRLVGKGFLPVLPPVLVREPAMYGTGFLPTDEVNIYKVERDDLYLTGTSEVALAGFHMQEILDAESLPLRYAGYSTNFRREAGAAGKDTRGMFRVHQFDKVEMFVYCLPEESRATHDELLAIEEELVDELELPYRVVDVAVGDLGASAARKFDIEAWFPAQGRYREITSTSNTTDYQARRLKIRYRGEDGDLRHVHTLNGTAVTARAMLAILENFQDDGGSVSVPEPLVALGAPQRLGAVPAMG